MSEYKVNTALLDAATALLPDMVFIAENRGEKPIVESVWANTFFNPGTRRPVTLGDGGEDELSGFFQIDINVPGDSGRKDAQATADILMNYFVAGRRLLYDGQAVNIRYSRASALRAVQDESYAAKPVTVYFSARIQRGY